MNEYIVGIELIQDCFSDLWTLYLTFIGILLSILTLLYSFVLSKKDELKLIAEQIKINGITPLVSQRKCFGLLLTSIIMDIFCWCGMRLSFIFDNTTLFWLLIVAIGFTILIGGYVLFVGYKLVKQYQSDSKI